MVEDYMENFIRARYHLATARRMLQSYFDFEEKRFLVGVINESAKSVSSLVKAFLIFENRGGKNYEKNLKIFGKNVSPKYLDLETGKNLLRVLEVQRAQKNSPIEFAKKDKLILLINGKYRFLTAGRLGEFLDSIEKAVFNFPVNRQ